MRNLVEQSLAVAIFGFLPLALNNLRIEESVVWMVSSGVLAFLLVLDIGLWIRRAFILRRLNSLRIWMAAVGLVSLITAFCLQLLNAAGWYFGSEPGPYAAGLLLLLFLSGLQFGLLIFGRLGELR